MADKPPKLPVNFASKAFAQQRLRWYDRMLNEAPVCRGRVSVMGFTFVARHADCVALAKDSRFLRNRQVASGKSALPIPVPKSVQPLLTSMITTDGEEHRRLRGLVARAFTPKALAKLESRVVSLTHELIDGWKGQTSTDLIQAYCLPIPVTVIRELLGVEADDMPRFAEALTVLTEGFSGLRVLRSFLFDIPKVVRLVEEIIDKKRKQPADDILSALIHEQEEGDALKHDELVSLCILLIIAGYETTVHLLGNAVLAFADHPGSREQAMVSDESLSLAVEEILRTNGPIQGSKPAYAVEDVELGGQHLKAGTAVVAVLGAANRDPAVFEAPGTFRVDRSPNKHLGFGTGPHYCLGAALARLETKAALRTLYERLPRLRLAVERETIVPDAMPLWLRHKQLPVVWD